MPFVNKGAPPESFYYAFLYGAGRGEERFADGVEAGIY